MVKRVEENPRQETTARESPFVWQYKSKFSWPTPSEANHARRVANPPDKNIIPRERYFGHGTMSAGPAECRNVSVGAGRRSAERSQDHKESRKNEKDEKEMNCFGKDTEDKIDKDGEENEDDDVHDVCGGGNENAEEEFEEEEDDWEMVDGVEDKEARRFA
ncbi:hypothetical protein OEA41_009927 [Lepraria neglecta]|uniref:Uncharacterized protein n=1 Tax=Lepraria neglecta TaxID=209136 RepID=A0AAD9YY28_9LECA|nr:hypothetical protein OEA41_009927 [Lepraria neglecta]